MTTVSLEVVTGTRAPVDVMTVKPAVLASDTVPWTRAKPGGVCTPNGGLTLTRTASIVPPEPGPATTTDAPSVMSLSSAPDMLSGVDAVVVTVTGCPLAVLMTRLPPFSCVSVPLACSIAGHPLTAVRTVPDECPPRAAAAQ